MAPRWTDSTGKHGIPRDDQVHAIVHATYTGKLPENGAGGGEVWLYIGRPHPQTDREIEILVEVFTDGREALVFHAMDLGPKFRRHREENPNG
ncbi:hypothetical protein [uncultured Schumannella sp.]|uniref:hypothetical protein n=1 Tax=uncultured Schumannella sp. TaxID=1195956 RepID=UPI0025D06613|nr:hypothetical protein [uncultured Schumannella sp.]